MIVPGSANALMLGGKKDFTIARSLRFRSSASANLTRTPASAGNRKTFTFSYWLKRGTLGTQGLYQCGTAGALGVILFTSNNQLAANLNTAAADTFITNTVFRDTSAWYHIVLAVDTNQATAADRVKLYVNGVQVTSFASTNYPALGADMFANMAVLTTISQTAAVGAYFDGYLGEYNFLDGQALTPSSFGEFDATTGVWKPKKYAGTYGTNGFYLPFSDNASTSALAADKSGNGNNWTTNNISLTAGATYDSMTDVPTLTSATASNFAVLNPLDKGSGTILYDANLLYYSDAAESFGCNATIGITTGKFYWEATSASNNGISMMGIRNQSASRTTYVGVDTNGYAYYQNGQKYHNNTGSSYGASWVANDVIGIAFDADAGTLTFYKNGVSQGVAFTGIPSNTWFPAFSDGSFGIATADYVNFGQRPFAYTPPTGFNALNTFNLPEPGIKDGKKHFDATLYTGNGGTNTITNAAGFSPDLVWLKSRSAVGTHCLFDTIRGATNLIQSNATAAEVSGSDSLTAFNSNGFTLGADFITRAGINGSGVSHVAWQWDAGSSTVTNTAGSISAQVRANPSAGFSVITATSNGADPFTVGHGLGVAPKMYIFKNRDVSDAWYTWHTSLPSASDSYLTLNSSAAVASSTGVWGAGATSTTIGIRSAAIATNTRRIVIYAFAEVPGFSSFGRYTGNGSADGTFVHTGFRPRYVMIKGSSIIEDWIVYDTVRNTFNVSNLLLYPNLSAAEATASAGVIDILSNGFKVRGTAASVNNNGSTYIYMALAENPFKYSLAR